MKVIDREGFEEFLSKNVEENIQDKRRDKNENIYTKQNVDVEREKMVTEEWFQM